MSKPVYCTHDHVGRQPWRDGKPYEDWFIVYGCADCACFVKVSKLGLELQSMIGVSFADEAQGLIRHLYRTARRRAASLNNPG